MENFYEVLKNDFITKLAAGCPEITLTQVTQITNILDGCAASYEIKPIENQLIVYTDGVPEIVKTYIAVKKVEGLADGTLRNRLFCLKLFFGHVKKPVDKITVNDIRVYLYEYQQERGVSGRTLDKIRVDLGAFFKWAACEEYIPKDPTITLKPIKYEKKQRVSLSQIELEYVRRACKTLRDKAMIEFFYSTGCRVSEMAVVKKSDVDFLSDEVHLFGKGKKHRTSYLNAKAHVALQEYLNSREDDCEYLFVSERKPSRKIAKAALEKAVRSIMQNASGVQKHVTPHIFRHTTASQAVASGMPIEEVRELLGHESVATTMIYLDRDQTRVKADHKRAVI